LTEWRWTALAIFSLQTPATSAFAKSLPTESSRQWPATPAAPAATAHQATPAMEDWPSTPSYPPLKEWLWMALATSILQTLETAPSGCSNHQRHRRPTHSR